MRLRLGCPCLLLSFVCVVLVAAPASGEREEEASSCRSQSLLQKTAARSLWRWEPDESSADDSTSVLSERATRRSPKSPAPTSLGQALLQQELSGLAAHNEFGGPVAIILLALFLSTIVGIVWTWNWFHYARVGAEGGDGQLEPKPLGPGTSTPDATATSEWTIRWLRVLVLTTFALLGLQSALAAMTRSMTLLGDLGHTAADAVSFGFAYLVEVAKADLGRRGAACLDVLSCLFSMCLVGSASLFAAYVSLQRLLTLHDSPQAAMVPGHEPDEEALVFHLGSALVVFSIFATVVDCGLLVMNRWYKPESQRPQALLPSVSEVASAAGESFVESLNEYGVVLHLCADVVRGVVIFITGCLVVTKCIDNVAIADAITSLVVVTCVLAGSAYLVKEMFDQLPVVLYG